MNWKLRFLRWPRRAPKPVPETGTLTLSDGREVSLVAVYVGQRPASDDSELLDSWQLWVHPDWPEDIRITPGEDVQIRIDVAPGRSRVDLQLAEEDGMYVVRRLPG